jgi:hypothetical protein|tara:strand:+ start:1237 stop:1548 length:312 start_codon:yes stop_codon:yes gene_type:complete
MDVFFKKKIDRSYRINHSSSWQNAQVALGKRPVYIPSPNVAQRIPMHHKYRTPQDISHSYDTNLGINIDGASVAMDPKYDQAIDLKCGNLKVMPNEYSRFTFI